MSNQYEARGGVGFEDDDTIVTSTTTRRNAGEDDLSYIDFDGEDYTYADEEEEGETKALLLQVIRDNKKLHEKYEEQSKKYNEQSNKIKRLEEKEEIHKKYQHLIQSEQECRNREYQENFKEYRENFKGLQHAILDIVESKRKNDSGSSSSDLNKTRAMDSFDDDIQEFFNTNKKDDIEGAFDSMSNRMSKKKGILMGFNFLNHDTYNLMMLSKGILQRDWLLGFAVFLFQFGLGGLTLYSQIKTTASDFNDTIFQIPVRVRAEVSFLQISSIIISVYGQEDVFNAIALPIDLRLNGPHPWGGIPVDEKEKQSRTRWLFRIFFPNLFKLFQGSIVLFASIIVILQSTEVIDLLKDFTALYVISSIDNIFFSVARRGFFGTKLLRKAVQVEEVKLSPFQNNETDDNILVNSRPRKYCNGNFIKSAALHTILALSISTWILVAISQERGVFAKLKYPKCEAIAPSFKKDWRLLENNVCNMIFNHPDCAYDGGDCSEFNLIYPGCDVEDISLLGNGECNGPPYDSKYCRYDGGDCSIENSLKAKYPLCEDKAPSFSLNWAFVENGFCDMVFNVPECGMDGGDCTNFNLFYPGCNEVKDFEMIDTSRIGDGICDGYPYNFEACLFDGGDCREDAVYCDTKRNGTLGDDQCDEELNVWKCYFDRGDCSTDLTAIANENLGDSKCDNAFVNFNFFGIWIYPEDFDGGDCIHPGFEGCTFRDDYPNFVNEIRDDKCHNTPYHNKEECGWDGGDCIEFNQKYPNCTVVEAWKIGDDECDDSLNIIECGYDEGDCCEDAEKNGSCYGDYNTLECYWDKGDCIEFNQEYPDCSVSFPIAIGDGKCDGGQYNTEACGWDEGDCTEFNEKYPNCTAGDPYLIGNGRCHSGLYNTEECGFDGGDCIEFNEKYPDCTVNYPYDIGNDECNGGLYNTEECGWDGGDCIEFNEKYPNCTAEYPYWIGNEWCNYWTPYNTAECGWDGGDCLLAKYPDCRGRDSDKIGDGKCDGGMYNTDECAWDAGDCIVNGFPDCHVDEPTLVGDGICNNYGDYNTIACGLDGGDCKVTGYPDCRVDNPDYIGNNNCNGGQYNTEDCGWDGGDCDSKNEYLWAQYPNCTNGVDPDNIGDDNCNGGQYNTEECGWDDGDCLIEEYPNCHVDNPDWIGSGFCSGGQYNTEACGWDDGDCLIEEYPNCHVDYPSWIGNNKCNEGFNSTECGYDGGDCIGVDTYYNSED